MMRRIAPRRRLLTALVAAALAGGALSGCGVAAPTTPETEEAPMEFGDVSAAVTAAAPRVVAVEDPGRSQNGFGHRLDLTLRTDSSEPFSPEDLDAVAEAVWQALPWEPNAIALVAGVETPDGAEPVDLRAAAAQLSPMGFTEAGQGGVSLFDMSARYGAWTAPG